LHNRESSAQQYAMRDHLMALGRSEIERLINLISVFCIVSWCIFWMTKLNRTAPEAPPNLALTDIEIRLLDHLVLDNSEPNSPESVSRYIIKIVGLGGYLARANDPGNRYVARTVASPTLSGAHSRSKICG
jgi:hypothetical protein